MGSYTDSLFKKNRFKNKNRDVNTFSPTDEVIHYPRIVSCAIIRNGRTQCGHKSHADIRRILGDENPYTENKNDRCGFMTSDGRFVDRREAVIIGAKSGQCSPMGRELLSSDINSW